MIDTNEIFKFRIGQWVKLVGTVLPTAKEATWHWGDEVRYVVQERWLQDSEVGPRILYHCMPVRRAGDVAIKCIGFMEFQLEPSRSYADDPKPEKADA